MVEREELIRDLAARFQIKGFEQSPIEREQAHQFLAALNDVKRRQHAETDRLQLESRTRNEEYNVKSRQLHTELEGHKQERRALRERVVSYITRCEAGELDIPLMCHSNAVDLAREDHWGRARG